MGKRDYRQRETKKPKKSDKKIAADTVFTPSPTVDVIKKKRKESPEAED